MRIILILSSFSAVLCAGGPANSQVTVCQNSDECVLLTHTQLTCIAKRINRLLARETDPVYFDAARCDDQSPGTMSGVVPRLTMPQATETPVAKWIQISKTQLKCLRKLLPSLQDVTEDPVPIALSRLDCP
jgi:hypothetical protein